MKQTSNQRLSNSLHFYQMIIPGNKLQYIWITTTMLYDAHDVPEAVFLFNGEDVVIYSVAVATMNLDIYRKCQDYVYIKWEYWSTMQKIKHI